MVKPITTMVCQDVMAGLMTAIVGSCSLIALAVPPAIAGPAGGPATCGILANRLLQRKDILSATSAVQPASNGDAAYCLVQMTVSELQGVEAGYLPGQKQMINIDIGLPLSRADGGSGGVQGAWNGRSENFGGGGYVGAASIPQLIVGTDAGYAASDSDAGNQDNGSGAFALNANGTLNWGLIRDFSYNAIHEQNVWTATLVEMYYGKSAAYNYFNGCSTGGRQAHMEALRYPQDFDGILGGDPALSFDRLSSSQLWGEVEMNQILGAPISAAKLEAVTQAAITACDAADGVVDGVIGDPRACRYSARQFVCSGKASDPANCLTPQEAEVVDQNWDGPPGAQPGTRLWFGYERGSPLVGIVSPPFGDIDSLGPNPFFIPVQWFQYWVFQNAAFDWHTLTERSFDQAFREGENKFSQVVGTFDPDLSRFKARGGKMIVYHGLADEVIPSRATYNYYNRVTALQGGLTEVQKFYRFFTYPGNNHCGGNLTQPNAPLINSNDLFDALVKWVEHDTAPDSILAYNGASLATSSVSRPICKYPDTAVYNGTGSTSSASSFHCQVNRTDPLAAAQSVLPEPEDLHTGDQ